MGKSIALVCALAGCSFVFTKGPTEGQATPDCTLSKTVPTIDMLGGTFTAITAGGAGIGVALADTDEERRNRTTIAGVGALLSIGYLAGSIVGMVRVYRCRKATQFTLPSQGASSHRM